MCCCCRSHSSQSKELKICDCSPSSTGASTSSRSTLYCQKCQRTCKYNQRQRAGCQTFRPYSPREPKLSIAEARQEAVESPKKIKSQRDVQGKRNRPEKSVTLMISSSFGKTRRLDTEYPRSIFLIIATEFCERFSFCGLRSKWKCRPSWSIFIHCDLPLNHATGVKLGVFLVVNRRQTSNKFFFFLKNVVKKILLECGKLSNIRYCWTLTDFF